MNSPPGSNGDPNGPGKATAALHRQFKTTLARASREEEPPSFPEVSAYVDGMLDGADREIFETRLASDPLLRAEVDELSVLRDAMREASAAPEWSLAQPARESEGTRQETAPAGVIGGPATGGAASISRGKARRARETSGASAASAPGAQPAVPAPSRASQPQRAARRAAKRSVLSVWMIASLATASAAAIAILAVTWWKGAPSASPPASTQASGSAPPPAPGAGPVSPSSSPPSSTPPPAPAPAPALASAILIRDAGQIIAIDTGGRLSGLPDTMMAKADMITQALRAGILPGAAAHKGLGQRELTLMGSGSTSQETLAVLAPIGTVVRETQPTFRWTAHPGARAYVITIYSASFDVVITSPSVRDTAWKSMTVLKPGAMYLWQVTADTPDGRVHAPTPPAPDARFRVIDEAARRALERDLASAGSSRLLAGLVFADAGLLDDAEQAFTALAKDNPGSEPVARLLTRVRERKGQE